MPELKRIDLHIHSTASDGTLTPSEILDMAESLNLRAIAITDHDSIEGSKTAFNLDRPASLELLTGVEISVAPPENFSCPGSFHILGYGIRLDDNDLNRGLESLQEARNERNPQIVEKLRGEGFDISISDITSGSFKPPLGRPHIARHLVKKGWVKDMDEAFSKYLAKGKPAYVDKRRLTCRQGIQLIANAGGIPVLAHPFLLDPLRHNGIERLLPVLKSMGLKGLEAFYTEHSQHLTNKYARMAEQEGLLVTGGSDFHGAIKPDVKMGTGKGNLHVPFELYEILKDSLGSREQDAK